MKAKIKEENGFTLIEIIGVIVIMSILAAVAIQRFADLQGRAREKAIYTAVAELKSRVNAHFCNDLLDGRTPTEITFTESEVGVYLSKDFLVEKWDSETDALKIIFDLTYYPDPTDHTKNPMKKVGMAINKPVFGI